ncbi:arginase [Nisaea denitrificans]|uniref:arginase n=1 Tax=Nisaea denitrificans TaxID=390877 RepID=UPI00048CE714|nr:arginase [Nisaea denitrificans]
MTDRRSCVLVGAPVQIGAGQPGCLMGPDAFRTAGLGRALESLGHSVEDLGNCAAAALAPRGHPNKAIKNLTETAGWVETLTEAAYQAKQNGRTPIFLGGDHALAAGTLPGIAKAAKEEGRELFVLWLDAHTDYHDLDSTESGNLHGVPVAYFTGRDGFDSYFPPLEVPVKPENITMMGIRSVDPAEHRELLDQPIEVIDMRAIDEHGVNTLLKDFLARVEAADGIIHVSLDVDFLDPEIAPAVGTTVPGGATFREAHLIMEKLNDCGRVGSLDLVELNPFLDERGKTARLMVDLAASLFGRKVMDRPTRSF